MCSRFQIALVPLPFQVACTKVLILCKWPLPKLQKSNKATLKCQGHWNILSLFVGFAFVQQCQWVKGAKRTEWDQDILKTQTVAKLFWVSLREGLGCFGWLMGCLEKEPSGLNIVLADVRLMVMDSTRWLFFDLFNLWSSVNFLWETHILQSLHRMWLTQWILILTS